MEACIGAGVTSFKMFMAYPGVFYATDGEILLAMQQASRTGATIMMHAENGIAIDQLVAQAIAAGRTDPVQHGLTRPPELEGEATGRAITLRQGGRLPALHRAPVGRARAGGGGGGPRRGPERVRRDLPAVPLPDPRRPGAGRTSRGPSSSPRRRCAPRTTRPRSGAGLRTNDLAVVSTDHCPFCFKEQKELGRGDFSKIPNGIPGVEHRMDLLHQGVVAGEITLERWVETCSTTPARMFGLYPRKGVIAPGADADIVIYDPAATQTLGVGTHHMNVDYSAYEGMEITGKVDVTISRGRVVVADGEFSGSRRARRLPVPGSQPISGLTDRVPPAPATAPRAVAPRQLRDLGGVMEFGVVLQPNPPASGVVAMMKRAEEAGFGYGWTFDSHVLWQETFVIYPRILAATSTHDRRADGDQPGDPGLVGDRVDVRHAQRRVRQPDDLRHRPRRLRPPVHRPGPGHAGHPVGRDDGDQGAGRGARGRSTTASRCGSRGCATARCRSGWRPTAPRRCGWSASRPTGSSCRRPTRTSPAGRSARSGRRREAAGRDPSSITMCVAAPAYVGTDLAHQRDQLRWFGGMVGNHVADLVARYGTDGPVPRALTDYIAGRPGLRLLPPRAGGQPVDRLRP